MKKQEFDETLKEIGLSRQEFATMTNLSYGAVSNWHDEKKPVPGWVKSWLENYVKAKDMDKVVDAVTQQLFDLK
jgi:DNA-binding transcriptional regulator YiaG